MKTEQKKNPKANLPFFFRPRANLQVGIGINLFTLKDQFIRLYVRFLTDKKKQKPERDEKEHASLVHVSNSKF